MASLEEAFANQINIYASARNPNAYLAIHQQQYQQRQQQEPEWAQQFNSYQSTQHINSWQQQVPQEWIQPKQQNSQPNDLVTLEQAVAQIAHQHKFHTADLKQKPTSPNDTHWWFIRGKTGIEYCYPKRFNYKAGDD